jgi:hypothetical protein
VPSENPDMQMKPPERHVPFARLAEPTESEHAGRWVRIALLAIAGMLAGVFALALYLNPYRADGSPRTMATHTTLGLPPCNFVIMTGKPCPSCGMTTSFSLLVRGDVSASLKANWVGALLAVAWAVLMIWCVASAAANRLFLVPPGRGEVAITLAVGGFLVLMLGRWVAILIGG